MDKLDVVRGVEGVKSRVRERGAFAVADATGRAITLSPRSHGIWFVFKGASASLPDDFITLLDSELDAYGGKLQTLINLAWS